MHRLDIELRDFDMTAHDGFQWKIAGVVFYIDHLPVAEFLRQFEPEVCGDTYTKSVYGRWIGIDLSEIVRRSSPYIGASDKEFADYGNRVPLTACSSCGMYSCDGTWTRVTVGDEITTWTDFMTNPILNPVQLGAVPTLSFDSKQYRDAIRSIRGGRTRHRS